MLLPNGDEMYAFCSQHYYWESIENILIRSLGCEIQEIVYTDNCVILKLTPTNEQILMLFEYYKETRNEFHLWKITMEVKTPDGHMLSIKADALKWKNNEPSWMLYSGRGTPDTYEKTLRKILNLLEPMYV